MLSIPPGSTWLVLPSKSYMQYAQFGVYGKTYPSAFATPDTWHNTNTDSPPHRNTSWNLVHYTPGTILLAGNTVFSPPEETVNPQYPIEFVHILLPYNAYVNRFHFNSDSSTLKRIS